MKYILILLVVLIAVLYTKEGFVANNCGQYKSCNTCAIASGCSWCPAKNVCVYSKDLKSTDECNQMNVINSSFSCNVTNSPNKLDDTLYKNKIENRIPPPNVYITGKIQYTNEDVISTLNTINNNNKNLRYELPGMITSSLHNSIVPTIKDILVNNYKQGFTNQYSGPL